MIGWWTTGHMRGQPVDFGKMRKRFTKHKAKNYANSYSLPLSEAEQDARKKLDWNKEHEEFKKQQSSFHDQSNSRKNAALYVDIVKDDFLGPSDQITEEMVHEIDATNYSFIELMRPKVEMLKKWKEQPDGIRNELDGFEERLKTIAEQHDNPMDAVKAILGDMMRQRIKTQQANSPYPDTAAPKGASDQVR